MQQQKQPRAATTNMSAAHIAANASKEKKNRRMKIKALMSSSLGNSPKGRFICNQCQAEVGSAAALQNHVRIHGTSSQGFECQFCGFTTDVESERMEKTKKVQIVHGKEKTFLQTETILQPETIFHQCNEARKRRHCSDSSYRTTKH